MSESLLLSNRKGNKELVFRPILVAYLVMEGATLVVIGVGIHIFILDINIFPYYSITIPLFYIYKC